MSYNQQGFIPPQEPQQRRSRVQRAQQEETRADFVPQRTQQTQYQRPKAQHAPQRPEPQQHYQPQTQIVNVSVNTNTLASGGESYFDGGLAQQIGYTILGALVTIFTLGLCYPWAFCMLYRWEAKHTVINGRRLSFDGKAAQLFGKWVLWAFLTIITLGIYAFWLSIALKKWKTKHTHFA